jgi:glycerol kinase
VVFFVVLVVGLIELPSISAGWREDRRFLPGLDADERARRLRRWDRAVERCRGWLEDGDET